MKKTLFILLLLCLIATIIGLCVVYLISNPRITTTPIPTITPIPTPLSGIQQGALLIPSDATNNAMVGDSVALNFNGNILVTGGSTDNSGIGGAWIYVRSGASNGSNTTWSQQSNKLIGSGAIGSAHQGISVAIASTESKTILIGGTFDNSSVGATWVFVQTGSTWTQQGLKLVGSDHTGAGAQGESVSLSSDGNTALIGGPSDNTNIGASWVFTRSSQTWSQQGNKLIGSGYSGSIIGQGLSVALSSDGNTALMGAPYDNNQLGTTWIFVRSNQSWSQQGSKLIGSGAIGAAQQGASVSLSSDGNTAMIGGSADNNYVGAVWIFVRSNNTWLQQGNKLIASGGTANDQFGSAVSLDQDGNTAVIGSVDANSGKGQFYIFVRTNQNTWNQVGGAKVATGMIGTPNFGASISLSSDGSTTALGGPFDGSGVTGAVAIFV